MPTLLKVGADSLDIIVYIDNVFYTFIRETAHIVFSAHIKCFNHLLRIVFPLCSRAFVKRKLSRMKFLKAH